MIWQRLSPPWQICVEEAWAAYCNGSLPHGAVITSADGQIVARGRNRIHEKIAEGQLLHGHRLAHAEMNALVTTDWRKVDARTCVLYSSIEPCPMCIGAMRMAYVQHVHYAARDGAAGSASLVDKNAFLKSGNIDIVGSEDSELEAILIGMLIDAALGLPYPNTAAWIAQLSQGVPVGARLGHQLFETKLLRQWKDEGKETALVVDLLAEQVRQMANG